MGGLNVICMGHFLIYVCANLMALKQYHTTICTEKNSHGQIAKIFSTTNCPMPWPFLFLLKFKAAEKLKKNKLNLKVKLKDLKLAEEKMF